LFTVGRAVTSRIPGLVDGAWSRRLRLSLHRGLELVEFVALSCRRSKLVRPLHRTLHLLHYRLPAIIHDLLLFVLRHHHEVTTLLAAHAVPDAIAGDHDEVSARTDRARPDVGVHGQGHLFLRERLLFELPVTDCPRHRDDAIDAPVLHVTAGGYDALTLMGESRLMVLTHVYHLTVLSDDTARVTRVCANDLSRRDYVYIRSATRMEGDLPRVDDTAVGTGAPGDLRQLDLALL